MELNKENDFSRINKRYISILPFNPVIGNLKTKMLLNFFVAFYWRKLLLNGKIPIEYSPPLDVF